MAVQSSKKSHYPAQSHNRVVIYITYYHRDVDQVMKPSQYDPITSSTPVNNTRSSPPTLLHTPFSCCSSISHSTSPTISPVIFAPAHHQPNHYGRQTCNDHPFPMPSPPLPQLPLHLLYVVHLIIFVITTPACLAVSSVPRTAATMLMLILPLLMRMM
jgi:hypothetical protein